MGCHAGSGLQTDARWSVVMNIYAPAEGGFTVGI